MIARIANQHNLIWDRFEPKTIAIVGGYGRMGRRLAQEFRQEGYQVRQTGEESLPNDRIGNPQIPKRTLRRWDKNICRDADVVIFTVPISLLVEKNGMAEIFGRTPARGWRGRLIIDICSTKVDPLKTLTSIKGASVIGSHPMFGPSLKTLRGQTVFVCPMEPSDGNYILKSRLKLCLDWLKGFWERRGVQVVEIGPEEHDQFMPAVQFGVLLSVLIYGEGLVQSGASMSQVQRFGTPNSKAICTRLARMISPGMLATYVNLTFENPHNLKWLDIVIASLTKMRDWMIAGNRQAVSDWIQGLAEAQPEWFRAHFSDISTFIDECLANRDFIASCMEKKGEVHQLLGWVPDAKVAGPCPQLPLVQNHII